MFDQESTKNQQVVSIFKIILFVAVSLLIFGVYQLVNVQTEQEMPVLVEEIKLPQESFVVEISGAVKYPGVYRLEKGSRVIDLIKKAGGITDEADIIKIAEELNMASILEDEDRIFVSFAGTMAVSASPTDGKISLNSATQTQLEELEGIGEKRALEIILQRPYQSIDELLEKKVVSETIWENIKNDLKL